MQNLKRADEIEAGDKISFPNILEVENLRAVLGGHQLLTFMVNDWKDFIDINLPEGYLLAVHNTPEEMPDEGELLDRLLTLMLQQKFITKPTKPMLEVLGFMAENQLLDIPRLIKLTNDLGPFESEPPMGNPAWKLEGNEWVYHKELDETPCDGCNIEIKNCTCEPIQAL